MQVDPVLLGFVGEVLHLDSAVVVQIALVANEHLYRVCGADSFDTFEVVRDTFERGGHVNRVHYENCVSTMQKVLVHLLKSCVACCIPNVQF